MHIPCKELFSFFNLPLSHLIISKLIFRPLISFAQMVTFKLVCCISHLSPKLITKISFPNIYLFAINTTFEICFLQINSFQFHAKRVFTLSWKRKIRLRNIILNEIFKSAKLKHLSFLKFEFCGLRMMLMFTNCVVKVSTLFSTFYSLVKCSKFTSF